MGLRLMGLGLMGPGLMGLGLMGLTKWASGTNGPHSTYHILSKTLILRKMWTFQEIVRVTFFKKYIYMIFLNGFPP